MPNKWMQSSHRFDRYSVDDLSRRPIDPKHLTARLANVADEPKTFGFSRNVRGGVTPLQSLDPPRSRHLGWNLTGWDITFNQVGGKPCGSS